jgi:2-keto-4-pentenoate hydratase
VISAATADEAAALLWRLWSGGATVPALPIGCRPTSVDDAWQIQRALDSRAGPGVGWKIAGTSAAGQRHIGADGPVAGRLYRRCMLGTDAELDARALAMRSAEPEFAFRIARDIEPGETEFLAADVLPAVASFHPAIEVPDTRFSVFPGVGIPSLVADAMCAAFFVVGESVAHWRLDELRSVEVVMRRNGVQVSAGSGEAVLGDPFGALVWLANELRSRGQMLHTGDIVATGAAAPPIAIDAGDRIEAEFGGRSKVSVSFQP